MTTIPKEWYTLSKIPDGRNGCIIQPTLRGALEIAAKKLNSNSPTTGGRNEVEKLGNKSMEP